MRRDPIKPFLLILLLVVLGVHPMQCQLDVGTRMIRGEAITHIDSVGCASVIDVVDAQTFKEGDRILIHQAKGMVLSAAAGDSGTPTSQGSCGNFELATIEHIQGSSLYLTSRLVRAYDVAGLVQAVPVLYARRVNVIGDVTAAPWDGRRGGIIAIEATDTIVVGRPIRVSGTGFAGGDFSRAFGSCALSEALDARYPSDLYGAKGEGSAVLSVDRRSGRGRQANGGGGGANHNAGGGGGANGGNGGDGGAEYGVCGVHRVGGFGGRACMVDPLSPRLFFGGGGGGSHQNEGYSSPGGRGGGIILLVAPTIIVTKVENVLESNGDDVPRSSHEGSSGGGAGGTIFIAAQNVSPTLRASASGGQGGSVSAVYLQPHGPGGGGGGGLILLTRSTPDPAMGLFVRGGTNGVNQDYASGVNRDWYATPGKDGLVVPSCVFSASKSNARITQGSSSFLGVNDVDTTDTVSIEFVNDGAQAYQLDSVYTLRRELRVLSTVPTPPVTLAPGDTLVVRAEIRRPTKGVFRDTIIMLSTRFDGCADTSSFAEYWTSIEQYDSCQVSASVSGGFVRTGGTLRIAVRCSPSPTLQFPIHFVCSMSYKAHDLYVEPSPTSHRRWLEAAGDRTNLHVEGEWQQGDTVFTFDCLGLLSAASVTELRLDSMTITSGTVICTAPATAATITYDTLCATRPMRCVIFGGSQRTVTVSHGQINITSTSPMNTPRVDSGATYTIWTTMGAEYRSGDLEPGTTSTAVPPGLYIVAIFDGTSAPIVDVVMVVE